MVKALRRSCSAEVCQVLLQEAQCHKASDLERLAKGGVLLHEDGQRTKISHC